MKLYSTRNKSIEASFQEALFIGLAPDGGLYYPAERESLTSLFEGFDKDTTFNEIAEKVAYSILSNELDNDAIKRIIKRAFNFEPKLKTITNNIDVLELFHGPTCAFKDFGASFLAASMEEFLTHDKKKAIILTATSGDTGSAVAQAFYEKENIDVIILYPSGRVSPLQEKQLTTLGKNIHALEVKGSFDDCQRMVKEAFNDKELKSTFSLTSANSISIGRLLPQSFYYIWSWAQVKDKYEKPVFCVPSGNFGNLTAGLYADWWGLPVKNFIAATNANDIVPEYLSSGIYKTRSSVKTHSNAMDVGAPSNYERMNRLFNEDISKFREKIHGEVVTDTQTEETMKWILDNLNYLACPHTAVGLLAADRYLKENKQDHVISLSTAHPGKFVEIVKQVTGINPELPKELSSLLSKDKEATLIENKLEDLVSFLNKGF